MAAETASHPVGGQVFPLRLALSEGIPVRLTSSGDPAGPSGAGGTGDAVRWGQDREFDDDSPERWVRSVVAIDLEE